MSRTLLMISAFLAGLSGCQGGPRNDPNRGVHFEYFQKIDPGKTTHQQLVALCGGPTHVEFLDFGRDRFIYENHEFGTNWLAQLIPFGTVFGKPRVEKGRCEAHYDLEAGIVQDKGWIRHEIDEEGRLMLVERR